MRVENWESKLAEYIKESSEKPFKWGSHDCVGFAMGAVRVITGVDHYAPYRNKYKSRAGAVRVLAATGKSFEELISHHFIEINIKQAGRGDLVFTQGAVGVCCGLNSFFLTMESMASFKTLDCDFAWRAY